VAREGGVTIIRHDVIAKIAGTAIREVDGVDDLVPFDAVQSVSSLARRVTGGAMRDLGVSVDVGEIEAAVDARIVTRFGAPIPNVASEIRAIVAQRILDITGLRVVEINLEVADVRFAEDGAPAAGRVR